MISISKIKTLFAPVQSYIFNALMAVIMALTANEFCHNDLLHPLWILAFYFASYGPIRVGIDDFVSAKKAPLVDHSVIGFLRVLTGTFIVTVSTVHRYDFVLLWVAICLIFCYFGSLNMIAAAKILAEEAYGKAQEKRVQERAAQNRKEEEGLMEDLTAYLGGAEQEGSGKSDA